MKNFIYVSQFKTGPDATKRQQMMFFTEVQFALSEGYEYIQDSESVVFRTLDQENLLEVDVTEESLREEAILNSKPEQVEFDPTNSEDSIEGLLEHNLFLIQSVINNTLTQNSDITPQQADTMLKLTEIYNNLLKGVELC